MKFTSAICLVGMPSVGKSTIGGVLAGKLGYKIFDLDSLVEEQENRSLIEILNSLGADYFLNKEYEILKNIEKPVDRVVISPAGSVVYHSACVKWLEENTFVVFIRTPIETIRQRLLIQPKAVVGLGEKTLEELWKEREPMYVRMADISIEAGNRSIDEIASEVLENL